MKRWREGGRERGREERRILKNCDVMMKKEDEKELDIKLILCILFHRIQPGLSAPLSLV